MWVAHGCNGLGVSSAPTEETGFLLHRHAPAVRAVMNPVHYICAIRQTKSPQTPAVLFRGGRAGEIRTRELAGRRAEARQRTKGAALCARSTDGPQLPAARRNARRHRRRFDLAGCAGTSKRRRAADGPGYWLGALEGWDELALRSTTPQGRSQARIPSIKPGPNPAPKSVTTG